jgi:hypothetical protein
MQQILNDIKSLLVDESCSHTEKESVVSMTSIELNSSFDQDEQVEATDTTSSLNPSELFYEIQAKNFGADQVEYILDEKYLTEYLSVSYRVHQLHAQYAFKLIM